MTRLEQLRLDAGLSRLELAAKANVRFATIKALEDGSSTDPHATTRNKLAAALHAKPSELLRPAHWPSTDTPERIAQ